MKTTSEIKEWRRAARTRLIEMRGRLPEDERQRVTSVITSRTLALFPGISDERVGFYWPIRGEIDLRTLATILSDGGTEMSVPVITGRTDPLSFARWTPSTPMVPGTWKIPVPTDPRWVEPTFLLIPIVGFDSAGFRLGYGGGYYDRTLAAMSPRPRSVGVGYESGRLDTIYPQPHDLPLDAIATESFLVRITDENR